MSAGKRAPWKDYAGNAIYHGDRLRHPAGETFVAIHLDGFGSDGDAWRAIYEGPWEAPMLPSRLCLQIGDKGQAVVINPKVWTETVSLDFKQATDVLAMFGGEPSEITLQVTTGHSGKGLYAHYTDSPEEGYIFLGITDEEAVPDAAPSVPSAPAAETGPAFWIDGRSAADVKETSMLYNVKIYDKFNGDPNQVPVYLSAPAAEVARECGNSECGWKGRTNRMLGSIGPLCPQCGETTEAAEVAQPVADLDVERLGVPTLESELRFMHEHNPLDGYKGSTLWHRVEAALASSPSSKPSDGSLPPLPSIIPDSTPLATTVREYARQAVYTSSHSSAPAESGWQWVPKRTVAEAAAFRWLIENRISEDENGWMRLTFDTPRQGKDHPRAAYWVARDIAHDAGVDLDEPDAPQAVQAGGEGGNG